MTGFEGKAEELEQNVGLKILTTWEIRTRYTHHKKPVKDGVQRLKGKENPCSQQTIHDSKCLSPWELTPTPMAMSDICTALQQGTIDGAENPLRYLKRPYQEVGQKLCAGCPYTYDMTCWIMGRISFIH